MKKPETKVVLFDIDRTLMDTDQFIRNLLEFHVNLLGVTKQQAEDKFNEYISTLKSSYYFDYIELAKTLTDENNVLEILLQNYRENKSQYPKYADVDETLNWLNNAGFELGIFSEGKPNFQLNKLKNLDLRGINPDLVFIAQSKRTSQFMDKIPQGASIVDDNTEVIDVLVNYGKFQPIYINRINSNKHPQALTIESLADLHDLLS